jgi:hypothetical protein
MSQIFTDHERITQSVQSTARKIKGFERAMERRCRRLQRYVDNNQTPTMGPNTLFCNDIRILPQMALAYLGHRLCYVRQSHPSRR